MLVRSVSKARIPRAEVQRGHTERREPRDIRPTEFRSGISPDSLDKVPGGRPMQARARGRRLVDHRHVIALENLPHVLNCLDNRLTWGEAIVDRHGALVRNDIARNAPADSHSIEALAVLKAINNKASRHIGTQSPQNIGRIMHRIDAHPRPGAVRADAGNPHVDPNRALATGLDPSPRWFHEDRKIGFEQVGTTIRKMLETVELRSHLLALVEHKGDVTGRCGHPVSEFQGDGHAALHVAGPKAEQQVTLE